MAMSDPIVFYTNPMSRGRIVHWMLEEVGAPYRIELLSFEKGEHKSPAYLKVNPMGKVPAIVHRGTVVTEAAAICTYLADAFPEAGLAPRTDEPARGTYLRWLFFGAACIEGALVDRMLSRPAPTRTAALGYGSYEDVLQAVELAIAPGPYILGERFSAADVYLGAQLGWGMTVKALEPRPSFQAYVGRITQRPGWQRFMEKASKLKV
jgi:glutathione S-transferase